MENKGKILIVDDNQDVLLSINMLLKRHVEAVRVLTKPERIGEFMDSFGPDVILLDMNFRRDAISGEEGYQWLDFILKKDPKAVVLFITAYVDTEKAVRAIKAGAVDFIPKPWDNSKLLGIVESAIALSYSRKSQGFTQHQSAANQPQSAVNQPQSPVNQPQAAVNQPQSAANQPQSPVNQPQSAVNQPQSPGGSTVGAPPLIGESQAMQAIKAQIERIAVTDANVLITGENGTGKDVVAHQLHHHSLRADRPFVTIDLGTVPDQLFESELFGYEKGAFTDARTAKAGRVESADSGTVFLDEIGNLNASAQQKLLTLIEKREMSRLGSNNVKRVDVRLIAATNANLPRMVADGCFRQDLLYRINTIELHLPPLRDRGDDILLLAEYFAERLANRYNKPVPTLSVEAKSMLLAHTWPGNVRELQHIIERAIVMAQGDTITADDVVINQSMCQTGSQTAMQSLNLEALKRDAIMQAIERSNGNLTTAANLLGITRYALYRKIEKYGL